MKGNYIYYTSGRSPKVGGSGSTLLHAVNNYWYDNSGHAFEVGDGAEVVAEGNVFQNVDTPIEADATGEIFTVGSAGADCDSAFGRDCVQNAFGSSGDFDSTSSDDFISDFSGYTIASAASTDGLADSIVSNAGQGNL